MNTKLGPEADLPIGSVIMFAGALTPELRNLGWLPCDGASLPVNEYPDLYAAILNSFGGDSNEFFLPDLRGRFVRGVDTGVGRDPDANARQESAPGGNQGDQVGSIQGDELRAHSHRVPHGPTSSHWAWDEGHKYDVAEWNPNEVETWHSGGRETRPLNIYLNFIIRYKQA